MKWLLAILFPLGLGMLVGYSTSGPEAKNRTEAELQPLAITFSGEVPGGRNAFLEKIPPNGRYTFSELLGWHGDALAGGDLDLVAAVETEWLRSEDGSSIRELLLSGRRNAVWKLLERWSEFAPLESAELATSFTPRNEGERKIRNDALEAGISLLLRTNPELLLKNGWFSEHSGGVYLGNGDSGELKSLSRKKIEDALDVLAQIPDCWKRQAFARDYLEHFGRFDPEGAFDWVDENIMIDNRANYRFSVFRTFARSDPEGALRHFESLLDVPSNAKPLLSSLASLLPTKDGETIRDWFRSQSVETLRSLSPRPDSGDYQGWNRLADELGTGFEWMKIPGNELMPKVEWPVSDINEAQSFLRVELPNTSVFGESHPDWTPATMDQAVDILETAGEFNAPDAYRIARTWARFDPHTAFEWAAGLDPDLRIGAAEEALSAWFEHEPGKASAYVDSLPDSEFRRYAVERVAMDWLESSPESAVKWINEMPRGIDKDIGKREIVDTFRHRNPKRAYFNANAISNPVMRDEALEKVFDVWFRRDTEAATEYLNKANITDQRRAELAKR